MSELDSRLNDLRKRLLQQSQAETPPTPARRTGMLTAGQLAPDTRLPGEPEPRLYSVRRLLQNISPELEPVEQPTGKAARKAAEPATVEASRPEPEAPAAAKAPPIPALDQPAPERASSNSFQLFQAVATVFEQTNGLRDQLAE
jgi:hypothetical protein